MGVLIWQERCCVVSAHFVAACAEWCRAVELACDYIVGAGESAFEVGAYRGDEDDEEIVFGGMYAYLGCCSEEQGTYVESGSAFVGRDEAFVDFDDAADHFDEEFGGYFGHYDAAGCGLEAFCISPWAKDSDFAIGAAECFLSFEGFLAVVKAGGCHVEGDGSVGCLLDFAPCAVMVFASDVVVGLHVGEWQMSPVELGLLHGLCCVLSSKLLQNYCGLCRVGRLVEKNLLFLWFSMGSLYLCCDWPMAEKDLKR